MLFDLGVVKNLTYALEQSSRARGDLSHCLGDIADIQLPLEVAMKNLRDALALASAKKLWIEQDAE